jgi:uncharacterized membrane protein YsdA (DUF1294 family)
MHAFCGSGGWLGSEGQRGTHRHRDRKSQFSFLMMVLLPKERLMGRAFEPGTVSLFLAYH